MSLLSPCFLVPSRVMNFSSRIIFWRYFVCFPWAAGLRGQRWSGCSGLKLIWHSYASWNSKLNKTCIAILLQGSLYLQSVLIPKNKTYSKAPLKPFSTVRILWNNLKPVLNDTRKVLNYDGYRTIIENEKLIPGIKYLLLSALIKLRENLEKL